MYKKLEKYYRTQIYEVTFEEMFQRFIITSKEVGKSGGTIRRYYSDYRKFLFGSKIEHMNLKDITSEDITKLLVASRNEFDLSMQSLKNLYSVIRGIFKSAYINKIIEIDPCNYVDITAIKKKCRKYVKSHKTEDRILTQQEWNELENDIVKIKQTDNYLKGYALELASIIGCRIGELTVLKRSDFDLSDRCLYITHQEILECCEHSANSKQKYNYESIDVNYTKDGLPRRVPLTDRILAIYEELEAIKKDNGYESEYLFYDENRGSYMKKTALMDFLDKRGMKSIHTIRRTVASRLHEKGLPPKAVASLLGHSEMLDKNNYLYDSVEFDVKRKCIEDED